MLQASASGVVKMVLILIGAIVVLRFVGQMMNAKRNIAEEKELEAIRNKNAADKLKAKQNLGKVEITKPKQSEKNKPFDDACEILD